MFSMCNYTRMVTLISVLGQLYFTQSCCWGGVAWFAVPCGLWLQFLSASTHKRTGPDFIGDQNLACVSANLRK
jgi:hypothetical protein